MSNVEARHYQDAIKIARAALLISDSGELRRGKKLAIDFIEKTAAELARADATNEAGQEK